MSIVAKEHHNLLVCIVDDDESVRTATASLLRSAGYSTATFRSAADFLASSLRPNCVCVVADIQMPGMSGIELAILLGRDPFPTPVVLMTARADREALASAASGHAVCLLRKPFAAEQLLACILAASERP